MGDPALFWPCSYSPRIPPVAFAKNLVKQTQLQAFCFSQPQCAWLWNPSPAVVPQGNPAHLLLDLGLGPGLGPLQTLLLQLLLHLGFFFPESKWQWQQEMDQGLEEPGEVARSPSQLLPALRLWPALF